MYITEDRPPDTGSLLQPPAVSHLAPRTSQRFKEEQIIAVLREAEAGATTADLCRRYGVSPRAFYRWKVRFRGLLGRLRELEDELGQLKLVVAGYAVENQLLKGLLAAEGQARDVPGGDVRRKRPIRRQPGPGGSMESRAGLDEVPLAVPTGAEAYLCGARERN